MFNLSIPVYARMNDSVEIKSWVISILRHSVHFLKTWPTLIIGTKNVFLTGAYAYEAVAVAKQLWQFILTTNQDRKDR